MKYASEDLRNEHEGILFGLKILERIVRTMESNGMAPYGDLEEMVRFLKLFADKCHHGKEEGLFFPELEKAGIPKDGGPIAQMLLEHEMGRSRIKSMDEAIASKNPAAFTENARAYIDLLRAHIEKENHILFPMGDLRIQGSRQAELLEQFERFETEVMGKGTHESLHAMLNSMDSKYR